MVVVQANGDSVSGDVLREAKASLVEFIKASTNPQIASLYFQSYSGVSNKGAYLYLLSVSRLYLNSHFRFFSSAR